MKVMIAGGQGGWLEQVNGPDERGRLGPVRTGADALREMGVPVERGPAVKLTEALSGLPQTRDTVGRYVEQTAPASAQKDVEEAQAKRDE